MNEVTKNITEAYLQVLKGKPNLDEAKKLDPVDSKELKGTHAQRKDKDIDNDGDVDSSDEYLHNRRKTVAKAIKNESFDLSDYTVEEIKDFIMSEEFDQLDELSKATLGSYIKKSSDDRAQNAFNVGKSGKINYKGLKRRQGINRATNKLTKESFDLDEATKKLTGGQRSAKMGAAMDPSEIRIPKRGTKAYADWMAKNNERRKAELAKWKNEEVELDEAVPGLGQHPALKKAGIKHKWYQSVFKRSKTSVVVHDRDYQKAVKALGDEAAVAGGSVMVDGDKDFKESVTEAVTLDYSRYIRSHGKKPRDTGGATWMFTTAEYGSPEEDEIFNFQGSFADANKLTKEEVNLDEVSKDTLGRYAAKALNRGDMANRMSKSDDDGMGKIAGKRLAGVKKAVDKLADKTGKKALARSIKKDVDTAKASGNAFARGDGVDDQGKSYYKAVRNIGKMREEVELDEAPQPKWKVQIGKKHYTVTAPSTSVAGQKAKVLADKEGNRGIPAGISRIAEEVKLDDTRDTFDKQLATRKGEKNFVDMHKIETPEYVDAYSVNDKTFKALRMSVSNPKRRWNDLNIGDKKPVPNDGK